MLHTPRPTRNANKVPEAAFEAVAATGNIPAELFVTFDGVRIAKRGHPNTPHAKTWISLQPGFAVYDRGKRGLTIERHDVPIN